MTIERLTGNDVMELDCDISGTSMQVAGVLLLEGPVPLELCAMRSALSVRINGVRRLRQRLMAGPLGCGRPVWVDDTAFDIAQHTGSIQCAAPGGQQALLDAAAEIITRRLPPDRPLWSATLVEGLTDNRSAMVVVFHHALADGIGGLAVLAHLMDGVPPAADQAFPRRAPRTRELRCDAFRSRLLALRRLPAGLRQVRTAAAELGGSGAPQAPRCSLNRPIGARRALAATTVSLAAVKAAAHAQGGTVNDVILTAVAGALRSVLAGRGEAVDRLVISVPVSSRRPGSASQLGNQVGVIPMAIPTVGDPTTRLAAVARITRARKTLTPGSSATLIGPVFRILAKAGIFGWFINRQHRVNTFVSNLPGPTEELAFLGDRVVGLLPVPMITGNVSVAFGALSYAGTLRISVLADPGQCPDLADVATALSRQLELLTDGGPADRADARPESAPRPGGEFH